MSEKWTVQVERDNETGELVLPLPTDLLGQMGWAPGTDLFWVNNQDGSFTITDKKPDVSETTVTDDDANVGC